MWYDIKGYEGCYQINKKGEIFSIKKNKIRVNIKGPRGEYSINLNKDTVEKHFYVHRLLAQTFIPNPENKSEVNHIDGNPSNNDLGNLEWVTPKENIAHAHKTGLFKKSLELRSIRMRTKNSKIKLFDHDVREMRRLHKEGVRIVDLAKMFNSCISNVDKIVHYRTRTHIKD